uniref:GINS complex subunit 2 n=1 Tax=Sus scrofa TaxID=9823 RepID=A0A8D1DQ06_PIG
MDAAEVEFLAEKELVTIIPNFSLDKIYLIGGDLGPFNPGLPVQVPLWLAINLKQRQKCRLLAPEWMDVEKLEKMRDHERKEDTFTPAPNPHYTELTKLLLNHASDNIPKADEIRTLIKDVWDTRVAKLRVSADSFVRQQEAHAKLGWAFQKWSPLASLLFLSFRATPSAHGGSQARGRIGAVAAGLHRSHSRARSEPRLRPTPQPMAMPDPSPTERGQGSNLCPHGCLSGLLTTEPRGALPSAYFHLLDNLTLMEVNAGGAFLTRALSHMFKLRTNLQPADSAPTQDL